jgi:hypothetical protein
MLELPLSMGLRLLIDHSFTTLSYYLHYLIRHASSTQTNQRIIQDE